jgi:type IV pilus assembly protein PilM
MLKSVYPIAIDIRSRSVCAVQLKQSRKGLRIRGLYHGEPELDGEGNTENGNHLIALVREISRKKQFSGKKVALHLPARKVFSFPIRFKASHGEPIEEAMLRECKDYLSFPIGEAVIDYPSLVSVSSGESHQYRATIVAVRRSDLNQYLALLKGAGLSVEAVDFGVSSLIRLHNQLYTLNQNPVILCHIGHNNSLLSVVSIDRILAERSVQWGVEGLIKKVLANFELSYGEGRGRTFLKKYGLAYDEREKLIEEKRETEEKDISSLDMYRAVYQVITPYMENMLDELYKMLGYLRSEERNLVLEGMYIYGQGSAVRHLDGYLGRRLNVPARLVNALADMTQQNPATITHQPENCSFDLALGLAMRKVAWL